MTATTLILLALAVFGSSLALCCCAALGLRRWRIVDIPNTRSSHEVPVPHGGGIGFISLILCAWIAMSLAGMDDLPVPMLAGALAIAAISFADDLSDVSRLARLLVQALAIGVGVAFLPFDGPVLLHGLPVAIDRVIVGLLWLWFLNLFNFMDGIDGMAAVEAITISFGIVAIAAFVGRTDWPLAPALVVGAAAAGFLPFNLPRARVFMGDVGSVTLGYVIGWLLILLAARGAPVTAFLLALYFLADATSTLLYRAWRGEPLFQAHRRHAYQRAVDRGLSHRLVSGAVGGVGVALAVLGAIALVWPVLAAVLGIVVVTGFILWLRHGAGRIPRASW